MGPFVIEQVRKNVVLLDSGDVWSMSRLVKWQPGFRLTDSSTEGDHSTLIPSVLAD